MFAGGRWAVVGGGRRWAVGGGGRWGAVGGWAVGGGDLPDSDQHERSIAQ